MQLVDLMCALWSMQFVPNRVRAYDPLLFYTHLWWLTAELPRIPSPEFFEESPVDLIAVARVLPAIRHRWRSRNGKYRILKFYRA